MIKRITAYQVHQTGIGEQAAFTYSEIDQTGNVIAQNKRAEVVILDEKVLEAVKTIYDFLQNKIPE